MLKRQLRGHASVHLSAVDARNPVSAFVRLSAARRSARVSWAASGLGR